MLKWNEILIMWIKISFVFLSTLPSSTSFLVSPKPINSKIEPCSRLLLQKNLQFPNQNFSSSHPEPLNSPIKRLMSSTDNLEEKRGASIILNKAISMIGKKTNILVSLTFFISLAYFRDAFMVSFFIGAVSNGILGKILKKVISQARPEELANMDELKLKPTDNGMPSSHGMSLGFICLITAMKLPQTTIPLILFVASSLTYRINSNLHTKEQIFVGLSLGSK